MPGPDSGLPHADSRRVPAVLPLNAWFYVRVGYPRRRKNFVPEPDFPFDRDGKIKQMLNRRGYT